MPRNKRLFEAKAVFLPTDADGNRDSMEHTEVYTNSTLQQLWFLVPVGLPPFRRLLNTIGAASGTHYLLDLFVLLYILSILTCTLTS